MLVNFGDRTRRPFPPFRNLLLNQHAGNSTFLFDKQTNHSPKLAEFREIVRELVTEEGRARSKARPEESGRRRLRVCATSSLRSCFCAVPKFR